MSWDLALRLQLPRDLSRSPTTSQAPSLLESVAAVAVLLIPLVIRQVEISHYRHSYATSLASHGPRASETRHPRRQYRLTTTQEVPHTPMRQMVYGPEDKP